MTTTQEILDEFDAKALSIGLSVDCPASGFISAEIAIVAEAPGEKEVRAKSPLVGGSGSLLWSILREYNITRSDCWVTNAAKRQVAFGEDDDRVPLGKHEAEQWYDLLRWELQQLPNLRVILALGNHALKGITGHDGITGWRGSVLDVTQRDILAGRLGTRNVKVVAAYNPAFVIRKPALEPAFRSDMHRVARVRDGTWKPHRISVIINPSLHDAIEYLAELRRTKEPYAHDIETMGGETACFGFATTPHEAICINLRDARGHRFDTDDEVKLREAIAGVLGDRECYSIMQNGMFDQSWEWYKDGIKGAPLGFDTMLAHHTLFPMMPHDLGYICTQYTTHPYYKNEKDEWREQGNIDDFWTYNGKDCCITYAAAQRMMKELEREKLDAFFYDHVMRAHHHLLRMVVGGVKMDVTRRQEINEQLRGELEVLKQDFYKAVHQATADPEFYPNPNSPQALSELLFKRLRLVGRGVSTDEENRKRMYSNHRTTDQARDVLLKLDTYKAEHKFFSTYIDTAIDEDGRMRCIYKQTGVQAAPGRLSSAKTLWGHFDIEERKLIQHGANLQNQPSRAYEQYIADDGYCFFYFDGSQAEARFVAWDAEIAEWIEQFERARIDGSYDAHRALASSMFKIPYEDVPTADEVDGRKTIRYIAKRCRHGLNYRMQPDRLASTTGLSLHEAQRAFELYHRQTPELQRWWRVLEQEARSTRELYNSYGRRLKILGRLDDPETLKSIVAFRPQSTIGDHVTRCIYMSESDPRWPATSRIVMNIHDALVGLAPLAHAKLCLQICVDHMETPIVVKPSMPPMIIPAEMGISLPDDKGVRRWSTIKKIKSMEALEAFDLNQPYSKKAA